MNQNPFAFVYRHLPKFALGAACLIAVLLSVNGQRVAGQSQSSTKALARTDFPDGAVVSGTGSAESLSGVTIATLATNGNKLTKFVVSIASAPNGPDASSLKVVAKDKAGNEIEIEQSMASATGKTHMVITFVCTAKSSSDRIGEIIVTDVAVK